MAKPILKWAGGKTSIKKEICAILLQAKFERYMEPFFGGGAIFFSLNEHLDFPKTSAHVINDINRDLINLYKDVKRQPDKFVKVHNVIKVQYKKKGYYHIREKFNGTKGKKFTGIERSAALMVLNKTCYNGLYRVNQKGYFNVPEGNYKNISFTKEEDIFNASKSLPYLKNICVGSYLNLKIKKNDLIYFDPPYDAINDNSFTAYAGKFEKCEQKKLKEYFDYADQLGAKVLMSNSNTPYIRKLYKKFDIKKMNVSRGISPNAERSAKEVIIFGKNFYK